MDERKDVEFQEGSDIIKSQTTILTKFNKRRDKIVWCFNDMRVYILLDIVTEFFFGLVSNYYWTMLTSIERELRVSSTKMGFLMTAWDIGRLTTVLLLSFFGARSHIPRILGAMQLLRAAAIGMLILPHFLFGGDIIAMLKASSVESAMTAEEQALLVGNYTYQTKICHPPDHNATVDTDIDKENIITNSHISYGMFIASYVMFGISFPAAGTLGMMYLDNNFDKSKMPLLIAIRMAIYRFTPICASALATWIHTLYVDLSETTITFTDPKWISAWWLGLLITFIAPTIVGPLICLFPRRMRKRGTINLDFTCITKRFNKNKTVSANKTETPKKEKKKLTEEEKRRKEVEDKAEAARIEEKFKKNTEETYTIKRFPKALLGLLRNPVFMGLVLYNILHDVAWSGWATFQMKYYEQVFRVPSWRVTAISAVAELIVGPIGSLIGGIVIVRFRPTFARAALLMILTVAVWSGIGVGRMFVNCGDSTYAGLDYSGREQLMGNCNAGCECNLQAFSPVCDNGLTYFSPCHAGCEMGNITMLNGKIQPHLKEYFDCNCTHTGMATPGRCEGECDLIYLYAGLRGASVLVWSLTGSATTIMLIRSVSYTEKAFGLGTNMFLSALFGSIPSGPLIGRIMDGTCLVWQYILGEQGNCWIHDATNLRFRLYAWTLGLMSVQCFVLLAVYFLAKKRNLKLFAEDDPMVIEKRNAELEVEEGKDGDASVGFNKGYSKDSDIQEDSRF